MTLLARDKLYPTQTWPHTRYVKMANVPEFPVVFKVCIKPAFDLGSLNASGYRSEYDYFLGRSKFNSTIFGWAGHTADGDIMSNTSGKKKATTPFHFIHYLNLFGFSLNTRDINNSNKK